MNTAFPLALLAKRPLLSSIGAAFLLVSAGAYVAEQAGALPLALVTPKLIVSNSGIFVGISLPCIWLARWLHLKPSTALLFSVGIGSVLHILLFWFFGTMLATEEELARNFRFLVGSLAALAGTGLLSILLYRLLRLHPSPASKHAA